MSPDPSPRPIQELLAECLDLYEEKGDKAIEILCAKYPEFADRIRNQMANLRKAGLLEAPDAEDVIPERLGEYRILRRLGRGGMGVVFEAEQESPKRRVALKVIRTELDSASSKNRFALEAEMLAKLQHPGIAQVYKAGTAKLGDAVLPYFAMELITGSTLTQYAEEEQLDFRDRLGLLARVCDAVQHAHQKGVIHRDLKPSNILVDENGQPKILDFGVARAVDSDVRMTTLRTNIGQLVGTLAYMSPEQAAADPGELDTRSDVYSLGVIAYELLAGVLPYNLNEMLVVEAVRVIREEEPSRLSSLDRVFRGDIETIVATALAKEKERRYQSASDLAADIRRFLRDEPISARPPSAMYQLSKFTRRNKVLVGGVVAVIIALGVGLVGTLQGKRAAEEAQTKAEQRYQQAQAVLEFQRRILSAPSPGLDGKNVKVADVLDKAAIEIAGSQDDQPEVEAAVRQTIGEAYFSLGLWGKAEEHLRRALHLYTEKLEGFPENRVQLLARLARMHTQKGEYERAEPLIAEALKVADHTLGEENKSRSTVRLAEANYLHRRGDPDAGREKYNALVQDLTQQLGPEDPQTLRARSERALLHLDEGKFEEATAQFTSIRESYRNRYSERHPLTLEAAGMLTKSLQEGGRIDEARAVSLEILSLQKELLGENHPDTLATMSNVGAIHYFSGDYGKAEGVFRDLVEPFEEKFGPASPQSLGNKNNLAMVYFQQEKFAEAEEVFRGVLSLQQQVQGPEHTDTIVTMNNLALALNRLGKTEEAGGLYEEALALRRRNWGEDHFDTLIALHNLGGFYWQQGNYEKADGYYREAVGRARKALGESDFRTGLFLHGLGKNLTRLGRYEEAEETLLESFDWLKRTLGPDHAQTRLPIVDLKFLYETWGKKEKAAEYDAWLRKRNP